MPPFPGLGGVVGFWRALAEVDPQAIAMQAVQGVSIAIVGPPDVGKRTLRRALLGHGQPHPALGAPGTRRGDEAVASAVEVVEVEPHSEGTRRLPWVPGAHLYLYLVDGGRGIDPADAAPARQLEGRGGRVIYVVNKADQLGAPEAFRYTAGAAFGVPHPENARRLALAVATDPEHLNRELIPKMALALDTRALAMARALPGTREAVAQTLIADAAKANAQFALISSLPASIPLVGTLATLGADTVVLTKNQALLVFKLAAIHGRALDSKVQLAAEILPVVGAAFLWRSAARALVGLLPGLVSAVPKAAIAFAGTYVVGQSAHYYYRWGQRPRRETLERFSRDAARLVRDGLTGTLGRSDGPKALGPGRN
ncbi:MAG TPA: hypothetical protein VG370_10850 [Chloroflexota bacterium]|nr:hypothetical protein [Chloroflexota bacterium]